MDRPVNIDWAALARQNPEFTVEVRQAVLALRAGRREEAQRLLAAAVRADSGNATAWFWLSRAVSGEPQRRDCLERVARIDRERAVVSKGVSRPIIASGLQHRDAAHLTRNIGEQTLTIGSPGSSPALGDPTTQKLIVSPLRHAAPAAWVSRNDGAGVGRRAGRKRWAMALVVVLVMSMCAAAPLAPLPQNGANGSALVASGVVQAQEVELAAMYSGSVAEVPVRKGETVQTGQVIVRLDTSLIDAQIAAAESAVELAGAGQCRARAGARPGQVAAAEAQLALAQAAHSAATQAVTDTATLVHNPQEIQLEMAVTQAQIGAAEHKLAQALALKDAAEIGKDAFEEGQEAIRDVGGPGLTRMRVKVAEGPFSAIVALLPPEVANQLPPHLGDGVYTLGDFELEVHGALHVLYRWVTVDLYLPFEAHLAPNTWWQAWIGVNAAAAEKEGLEAALDLLAERQAQPQDLQARLHQATAAAAQAGAQVAAAQAQLDGLKAGATTEEIAALEAQVGQAEAAAASLRLQRDEFEIAAPIAGVVTAIAVHPGEVAVRGTTLVSIADLSQIRLTVYLPENQLGRVHLGQAVAVQVDSFPERTFSGRVTHIADRAEFTPRNVSTSEERVNLVFAVEVTMENPDRALKPGIPADATFEGGQP